MKSNKLYRYSVIFAGSLIVLWVAILAYQRNTNIAQREECVAGAERFVVEILRVGELIPADMRERLGPFESLSGTGYAGAGWNLQGFEYLSANRDAHFTNGTIPVRIIVTEGRKTNPGAKTVEVTNVTRDQLHLRHPPSTGSNRDFGLTITVSHPDLK